MRGRADLSFSQLSSLNNSNSSNNNINNNNNKMPSPPIAVAFLMFTADMRRIVGVEDAPWCWPTWQSRVKSLTAPWVEPAEGATHIFGWTQNQIRDAKAYVDEFCKKPVSQRLTFARTKGDDYHEARDLLQRSLVKAWDETWGLPHLIRTTLTAMGKGRTALLSEHGDRQLPPIEMADLMAVKEHIAFELFGAEGMKKNSRNKPIIQVLELMNNWFYQIWRGITMKVKRDRAAMEKLEVETAALLKKFEGEGRNPATFRAYLKKSKMLMRYYQDFGDKPSIEAIEEHRTKLDNIRKALAMKEDGTAEEDIKLSSALRASLVWLSTQAQHDSISDEVCEQIHSLANDEFELPALDLASVSLNEWESGVEAWEKLQVSELYRYLGLDEEKPLPFFNKYIDLADSRDAWAHPALVEADEGNPNRILLRPHWHQLVGMCKMLDCLFDGKPVLLMDGVGLGKTLQVVGVIAILAYYRTVKKEKGVFPGAFAERLFQEGDNIPELPSMIVVPPSLRQQVETELHRYLTRGVFDIMLYEGTVVSRSGYWEHTWDRSVLNECHRILLATAPAITSDGSNALVYNTLSPHIPPTRTGMLMDTIYQKDWLLAVVDEMHCARNMSRTFWSVWGLQIQSRGVIGMTATPVMSKIRDLWHIGRMLGIDGFDEQDEYVEMNKESSRALRADRRVREVNIEAFVHGEADGNAVGNVDEVNLKWMRKMRRLFQGYIVRRSEESRNCDGKPLMDLKQYQLVILELELSGREKEEVEARLAGLGDLHTARADGEAFYLGIRRAVVHPDFFTTRENQLRFDTLEDWQSNSSTKLDVMAKVVQWHLTMDKRSPMKTVDGVLVDGDATLLDNPDGLPRDKIVVFSMMVVNTRIISQVLNVHGIKHVSIHGSLSLAKRTALIEQFKASDENGPRVLIISSVGTTGLNLAWANILLCIDVPWSWQELGQMIGRLWRLPQKKEVIVYQLVALGTADVFLSDNSFGKGRMLEAFQKASPKLLALLGGEDQEPLGNEDDDSEDDVEDTSTVKKKGKGKSQPKKATRTKKGSSVVSSVDKGEGSSAMTKAPVPRPRKKTTVVNKPEGSATAQASTLAEASTTEQAPVPSLSAKGKGKEKARETEEDEEDEEDEEEDQPPAATHTGSEVQAGQASPQHQQEQSQREEDQDGGVPQAEQPGQAASRSEREDEPAPSPSEPLSSSPSSEDVNMQSPSPPPAPRAPLSTSSTRSNGRVARATSKNVRYHESSESDVPMARKRSRGQGRGRAGPKGRGRR
ncbi:hypothetical protein QCA50_014658 [Cerrena zonata]|uniref:Uncharacterized protein n=1 Tax=Cerrena zonata TaxID=2478898 RepID=A0AAW0FPL6_9APHY